MSSILFGGQLARKRAEAAKKSRKNSFTPVKQLQGLLPICEDWHAKQIFLEVWLDYWESQLLLLMIGCLEGVLWHKKPFW